MNDYHSTTAGRGGQDTTAPTKSKYAFDSTRVILFDCEVYPGRWCCGFLAPDGAYSVVVDNARLAEVLDKIHRARFTLCGYNSEHYDLPILRAIQAGCDPYPVSQALVAYDGWGLPPELRERADTWPKIKADTIDLASRTRMNGRIPSLKTLAANLGARHLQELPFPPDRALNDEEWEQVRLYNKKDLLDTRIAVEHFTPELQALAALSNKYNLDLRNVHQAGIAQQILCGAYRARHGIEPVKGATPASVRYRPPATVRRPQNSIAAEWFDRLVGESFPMQLAKGASHTKPVLPEPGGPIVIGGVALNVGSGGLHSEDAPALHRADAEHEIVECDVASYYPPLPRWLNYR